MTTTEIHEGTRRLGELEQTNAFPAETLRDLRRWWQSTVCREQHKVVSIDAWRQTRPTFEKFIAPLQTQEVTS